MSQAGELLEEATSEIKAAVKERMQKPFVYSFIFSWCAFNYRVLITLFSDSEALKKIEYIDRLHPSFWDRALHWGALPFLGALVYMFAVPWMNLAATRFGEWIETWGWPFIRSTFLRVQFVSPDEVSGIHEFYKRQIGELENRAGRLNEKLMEMTGSHLSAVKFHNEKINELIYQTISSPTFQ